MELPNSTTVGLLKEKLVTEENVAILKENLELRCGNTVLSQDIMPLHW